MKPRLMPKVGDILRGTGREVIDPNNGMSLAQQAIGEVGAEKSGSAGYKNVHATGSTFANLEFATIERATL